MPVRPSRTVEDMAWQDESLIFRNLGPAHAVYFGTYELVKELAGGNVDNGHHPAAAGEL